MANNDMRHMDYLERVMKEDLTTICHKENTYRGSWKKRGGIGAFFVAFRKVDRLEHIVAQHGYDIFTALDEDPSGADGSALAELRDLRCYLTLIEAEIISRNQMVWAEVQAEPAEPLRPGTPEDGGQHASFEPRLEDGLTVDQIAADGTSKYYMFAYGNVYMVNRLTTPEELWDHLPRLDLERNQYEYENLPTVYQSIYSMVNGKWTLMPQYVKHWGKEP